MAKPSTPKEMYIANLRLLEDAWDLTEPFRVRVFLEGFLITDEWEGIQNYLPTTIPPPRSEAVSLCHDLVDDGFTLELVSKRLDVSCFWELRGDAVSDKVVWGPDIRTALLNWLHRHKLPEMFIRPIGCRRVAYNSIMTIQSNCVNPQFVSPSDILTFARQQRDCFSSGLKANQSPERR